jgi:hypothetical protein
MRQRGLDFADYLRQFLLCCACTRTFDRLAVSWVGVGNGSGQPSPKPPALRKASAFCQPHLRPLTGGGVPRPLPAAERLSGTVEVERIWTVALPAKKNHAHSIRGIALAK